MCHDLHMLVDISGHERTDKLALTDIHAEELGKRTAYIIVK